MRPIGLTVAALRVWSRLRHPLSESWERDNDHPFFWGAAGKPCDMAGWTHNVVQEAALAMELEVATLSGDITKIYSGIHS